MVNGRWLRIVVTTSSPACQSEHRHDSREKPGGDQPLEPAGTFIRSQSRQDLDPVRDNEEKANQACAEESKEDLYTDTELQVHCLSPRWLPDGGIAWEPG